MLPPRELTKRETNQILPPNQNTLAGGGSKRAGWLRCAGGAAQTNIEVWPELGTFVRAECGSRLIGSVCWVADGIARRPNSHQGLPRCATRRIKGCCAVELGSATVLVHIRQRGTSAPDIFGVAAGRITAYCGRSILCQRQGISFLKPRGRAKDSQGFHQILIDAGARGLRYWRMRRFVPTVWTRMASSEMRSLPMCVDARHPTFFALGDAQAPLA